MSKLKDLTGQKFGKLTVIERAENDNRGNVQWLCQCECGNKKVVRGYQLTSNKTKSCGCLVGHNSGVHYKTRTRLFNIWASMKQRCSDKNSNNYKNYGAKGVKVCDEWQNNFIAFSNWAKANGYNYKLTIDRIDNNGNYEPSNCRWVDMKMQQRNRSNNHLYSYGTFKHLPFTAEKQIEIVKRILSSRWWLNLKRLQFAENFENSLAELVNDLWHDLTEQEKEQIRDILKEGEAE